MCSLLTAPVRYNTGEYLFDIHPPLGKLTFVLAGWLFGYDPKYCRYDYIGQVFDPKCKYMIFRYVAGTAVSTGCVVWLSLCGCGVWLCCVAVVMWLCCVAVLCGCVV